MPSLSAATLVSCRRCTTALMKCVVPIITPSIFLPFRTPVAPSAFNASRMPVVTSSLVRRLDCARDLAFFDQDCVGIGAADIDAIRLMGENTLLKSRS